MFRSLRKNTLHQARREGKDGVAEGLVTILEPASAASEDYRVLRTNLLYALGEDASKVIVLTSPGSREGKSTICSNLGIVLAQAYKSTLILDCDFRTPAIHKLFGLNNLQGITDVLMGARSLEEIWHEPVEGLKVALVGPIPPNPAELLSSQRFSRLLASVRKDFDCVLIDAPCIGLVSDPAVLASRGDAVLLIIDARSTRKEAVRQAIHSLEAAGANVLGTIVSRVKAPENGYYHGG